MARTALITGATNGIGYELTKLFAADGYRLVLVARDEDRLEQVAAEMHVLHGVTGMVLAADLADPAAPAYIASTLADEVIGIDALVNNAGFATFGPFAETDVDGVAGQIDVNVAALTRLTRLFLPGMLARKTGNILNVASTAAFQPGPLMATYYATKAYVLSFSEALAEEVRGTGVTVTVLCPGPTSTGFQSRAGMERSPLFATPMDAAVVAKAGYDGMRRGKTLVVPGLRNRIGSFLPRLVPRAFVPGVVKKLQEPRAEAAPVPAPEQPLRVLARALLLDEDGRILLARRLRGIEAGKWSLVGGKLNPGEMPEACVVREVTEETGLAFDPSPYAELVDDFSIPGQEWRVLYFVGAASGTLSLDPREHTDAAFVGPEDLEALDIAFNHREVLEEYFRG